MASDLLRHFVWRTRRGVDDEFVVDTVVHPLRLSLEHSHDTITAVALTHLRDISVARDADPRNGATGERAVQSIL